MKTINKFLAAPAAWASGFALGLALLASPAAQTTALAASTAQASDRVVAVVNNRPLLASELDRRTRLLRSSLAATGRPMPSEARIRQEALNRLIDEEVLVQRALQNGVRVDANMLDRAIARIAEQNKVSIPRLREQLQADGVTWQVFRDDIRREILISQLREREVDSQMKVSEAEIDAYLDGQGQAQGQKPEYRIEQLLLPFAAGSRDALQERANAMLTKARQGTSLVELAKDNAAYIRSDLEWRTAERLPEVFVRAMAGRRPGQMGELVESQNGFHLLRLTDLRILGGGPVVSAYRAQHVLLRVDDPASEDRVRLQIEDLRSQIQAGRSMEQVARRFSQDPGSAREGGVLDWAYPGDFVPEFERALMRLKIGELSEPVRTTFGFHLIRLLEEKREPIPVERARLAARLALREQRMEEAIVNWTLEARADSYVEVRPDATTSAVR